MSTLLGRNYQNVYTFFSVAGFNLLNPTIKINTVHQKQNIKT